jgi:hypothetical protein
MNIKRRLQNLECRPFRRPVARRDGQWLLPPDECRKMRDLQKKLCLPLPDAATTDERQEALRMMQSAVARTRIDIGDTAGLDELRDYASGLHAKYQDSPA